MASLPSRTQVIGDLITTTFQDKRKEVIDQVLTNTPFFNKMVENGRIRDRQVGGNFFEIPIRYERLNQNNKYLSRGATVGRNEKEHLTTATYVKRTLATSIPRWFDDEIKNKGPSAIIDYAAEKVDATKAALIDQLETDFLIQNADSISFHAMETLVATDPTTGTVGGINRATNDFWRNQQRSMSGLSIAANLIPEMTTLHHNCSNYKAGVRRSPDIILCDQTTYEGFESVARNLQQIVTSTSDRVSLGFGELMFKGTEIFYSPALAGQAKMYFLNTEHLEFAYDPDYWFEMTDWKQDVDGVDLVAQVLIVGQVCADNFIKQGVLHTIPAS